MRRAVLLAVGLAVLVGAAPVSAQADSSADAQYAKAAETILCDCGCHPQSVADCACGRAAEMRREIRAMIDGGMTGDAVIAAYVEQYGEQIRIAPTAQGFNLVAWLGPLLALVGASSLIFLMLRRWSRRRSHEEVPAAAAPVPDPAYRKRLDEALDSLE